MKDAIGALTPDKAKKVLASMYLPLLQNLQASCIDSINRLEIFYKFNRFCYGYLFKNKV